LSDKKCDALSAVSALLDSTKKKKENFAFRRLSCHRINIVSLSQGLELQMALYHFWKKLLKVGKTQAEGIIKEKYGR
jgi:hypothetical protein